MSLMGEVIFQSGMQKILYPKMEKPRLVTDFGSISFCNVSYQIVTKAIAKCLKRVLSEVVSQNQYAFVSGRAIGDNVIIGQF